MAWTTVTMTLGGLGLLLLGMAMMTDGLKAAAGNSLATFLERSTQTRLKAAFTGFGITALVQSSSAVIVATLGFTNAGMLRLKQAAWVVFGSNLGTTMTAWIVALIGLKIRVEVIALPLIGIGMLMKLFFKTPRAPHIGSTLTGFGVLFLGLGLLRDAFIDVADWIPIEQLGATGAFGIILGVLIGALLTALIQSSSAAVAIILTASVTGVLTPLLGAALVIGANIGTTATSLLATIGATTNARRLALVHVLEKVSTATIALILLAPMWWVAEWLSGGAGRQNISTGLALYHTLFNVMGLVLMWFLADKILRYVEKWIKQPELTSNKPRYLDDTVLTVPSMGVGAMHSELKRVFKQLLLRGRTLLDPDTPKPEEEMDTKALLEVIHDFGNTLATKAPLDNSAEMFLNLNWAREECLELRDNFYALAAIASEDRQRAINSDLTEALLQLLRAGDLKAMSLNERTQHLERIRSLRKARRNELLNNTRDNQIPAPLVTSYLHIISLYEDSAKRIVRVAATIYPDKPAEETS